MNHSDNGITASYWMKTAGKSGYDSLKEDLETEVLIVGGGITGVSCAYHLAKAGVKTALIEAQRLCDGTTGNTTGKVTIQHGIIYSRLLKTLGEEKAIMYADSNKEALQFVKDIVRRENIDCSLSENTAYIFAAKEDEVPFVEDEYEAAKKIGIDAAYSKDADFPKGNLGLLGYKHQAVFHSIRYVDALARLAKSSGAKIYENTKAIKINNNEMTVTTESGAVIHAKHIVLATQFPIYEAMTAFFSRLYPEREYGVAVRTARDWPDGSYINVGEPGRSIRTHVENGERILIVVGEGHYTSRSHLDMTRHHTELINYADELAGVKEVIAKWSAQDYKTPDDVPYIGRITNDSEIYVATGYGKWGLTSGSLAGMMICDEIVNGKSRYDELYRPSRLDLGAQAGTFVKEVAGHVENLVKSKFKATEELGEMIPGDAKVINYGGEKSGAYLDKDNILTIVDITCTHMGCTLNWNSAEKTWDCPCHGGRFSYDGSLIEGPPKNPLTVYYREKYQK